MTSKRKLGFLGSLHNYDLRPGICPSMSNLRSKNWVRDIVPKVVSTQTKMAPNDSQASWAAHAVLRFELVFDLQG